MPANLEVRWEGQALLNHLRNVSKRLGDMGPLMKEIAGLLADTTEDAFADERTPAGEPWAPLSKRYAARKQAAGYAASYGGAVHPRAGEEHRRRLACPVRSLCCRLACLARLLAQLLPLPLGAVHDAARQVLRRDDDACSQVRHLTGPRWTSAQAWDRLGSCSGTGP